MNNKTVKMRNKRPNTLSEKQKQNRKRVMKDFDMIKKTRLNITRKVKQEVQNQNLMHKLKHKRSKILFDDDGHKTINKNRKSAHRIVEIPLKQLKHAINILNSKDKDILYDNPKCKRSITELVNFQDASEYAPSSYTALCYQIQKCILSQDWSSLTECLVLLLDGPISLRHVMWKVAMLILLHNPHVHQSGIMEDFLKMCACCQTEYAMEDFLKKVLLLQDELKTIPRPKFKIVTVEE